MRGPLEIVALATALLALAGCATVQTHQEWARVGGFATERTGVEARWEQTAEDAQAIQATVAAALADGLTRKEAVQIALVNNRELQAAFEELGVAKADLVQAGLLTNPRIDALARFPTHGGGTNVEAEGLLNIADLWQIPVRKRLASTRMEATTLRVSDAVLKTAAGAKRAYDEAVALAAARDEAAKVLKALEELRDEIARRKEYGYTSDFDIGFARAAVLDQQAALVRAEGEAAIARTRLDRVLGLAPEQSGYSLAESLPRDVETVPQIEQLLAHALAHRPDVLLAELDIDISKRALELERARVFTDVEAGAAFEREAEGGKGGTLVGPALGLQLPIFDQNQAQIAKAAFKVRQAEKLRESLKGMVREEVQAAAQRLAVARRNALIIRDQVLPAYKETVSYAERHFATMQINMTFFFQARKEMFESNRRFIDSLREARAAEVDLELAVGGSMPRTTGEMKHEEMHGSETKHEGMGGHMAARAHLGAPEKGRAIYQRLCASCHGEAGKGDGPVGQSLNPRPADFTQHMQHHGDDYFFKAIKEGGPAVGGSGAMPAWGSQLKDEDIWDVVSYLRTFAQQP